MPKLNLDRELLEDQHAMVMAMAHFGSQGQTTWKFTKRQLELVEGLDNLLSDLLQQIREGE